MGRPPRHSSLITARKHQPPQQDVLPAAEADVLAQPDVDGPRRVICMRSDGAFCMMNELAAMRQNGERARDNEARKPRAAAGSRAVAMSTFASILVGIGIGLVTSVVAWFLTLTLLAPKVRIEALRPGEGSAAWPAYQFRVARRRWLRGLMNVEVHCDLRIPHHARQENVLELKTSSSSFPFVPAGWERVLTVSMEPASLTENFGQPELSKRLAELSPGKRLADIASLREIFQLIPGSRIEIVVFASDPLSGARRANRGFLVPASSQ
jgi:hypothetical protein